MQLPESDPKYQVCSSILADYTTGVGGRTYPSRKGRLKSSYAKHFTPAQDRDPKTGYYAWQPESQMLESAPLAPFASLPDSLFDRTFPSPA